MNKTSLEMEANGANEQNVNLRQIRKEFYIFTFGLCVCFSTYSALINLQTSTGIEGNIGTLTVSTIQLTAIAASLLISPIYVRKVGVKWSLLTGEAAYAIFVLSNAFIDLRKERVFVIIISVICGIGVAILWQGSLVINVNYAKLHSRIGKQTTSFYVKKYTSVFFGIFQFNQVFGNMLTFATINLSPKPDDVSNATWDYDVCGANDCQDPNITSLYLSRYTVSDVAMYSLTGIFFACNVIVLLTQYCTLKNAGTFEGPSKPRDFQGYQNSVFVPDEILPENPKENIKDENDNSKKIEEVLNIEVLPFPSLPENAPEEIQVRNASIVETLRITFLHLADPIQLLVTPLTIYNGMVMGFVWGELTRAGASCILGVSQVGTCMVVYGVGDIIFSFIVTKMPLEGFIVRNIPFAMATVFDCSCYITLLSWEISEYNAYFVYAMFFAHGCADGVWQTLLGVRHNEYFPEKQDVAVNCWSCMIFAGQAWSYLWSASLCVYVKIYVLFGLLGIGLLLYGCAESIHLRRVGRDHEETHTRHCVTITE